MTEMADYVLIHGGNIAADTWNSFTVGEPVRTPDGRMGGRVWDPVLPALRARGHRVFAPTLADEHTCDLSGHIAQVSGLVAGHELHDLVLVAHSYGGMVLTGVADRFAERVRRLVCVDAALPDDDQSLFSVIVAGGRDPLSFEGLEAAPPYIEKLRFDTARVGSLPGLYIACTESQFAPVTQLARRKVAASGGRWELVELPTGHVPMATMPAELSRLLVAAALGE
jgi:pimeloyl-ACP methyl ester carboxylesterase